jgi:hypothetical protein
LETHFPDDARVVDNLWDVLRGALEAMPQDLGKIVENHLPHHPHVKTVSGFAQHLGT